MKNQKPETVESMNAAANAAAINHALAVAAAAPNTPQSPAEPAVEQKPLIGEVDQTQINMWKALHRRVFAITQPDDGELFVGYFRRPDMDVLAATNKLRKDDEIKAVSVLFENCWLGGSEVMKTDAIVKMGAMGQFNKAISVQQGEIKNL